MLILNQDGDTIFDTAGSVIRIEYDCDSAYIYICTAKEYGKDPETRTEHMLGWYDDYGNRDIARSVLQDIAKCASEGHGAYTMPCSQNPDI